MNLVEKKALGRLWPLILLVNANKVDVQSLTLIVVSFYIAGACLKSINFTVSIKPGNLYYDLSFTRGIGSKARR